MSKKLLDLALPISVKYAKEIKMIDEVYAKEHYHENLHAFALSAYHEEFIWNKQDYVEENLALMESCKKTELKKIYPEFWDEDSAFHKLRYEFVYKICPTKTPQRLQGGWHA